MWWAISGIAFAAFAWVALQSSARRGIALIALAVLILIAAVAYDRFLRRI